MRSDARRRQQGRARRRPGSHPCATASRQRRIIHVASGLLERMKCNNDVSVKGASNEEEGGVFFIFMKARSERERERARALSPHFPSLFHLFFLCFGSLARQQQRATAAAGPSPSSSLEATHASSLDRSSSSSSSSAAEPWSLVRARSRKSIDRFEVSCDRISTCRLQPSLVTLSFSSIRSRYEHDLRKL